MQSMEYAFADFTGPRPTRADWLLGLGIPLREQLVRVARSPEELDWMIARYRLYQGEHHDRMTAAFPGVPETLATLANAGHRLGLVTSKFHAGAMRALTHVAIAPYFGAVIGCDSVTRGKPHPEPVYKALEELTSVPERALFVGDSPHDIAAGNAAGVATVAVSWGPFSRAQLEAANPTFWLDDIRSLPAIASRVASPAP